MENYSQAHSRMHPTPPLPDEAPRSQSVSKLDVAHLSQFVTDHPLWLWGGIWLSVLVIGAIAISGLLSPGITGRRASSASFGSTAGSEDVQQAKGRQGNSVPFWLFGAIAVTCTAGSILVSKRIAQVERPRKLSRPRRLSKSPISDEFRSPRPVRKQSAVNRSKPSQPVRKRLKPFSDGEFVSTPIGQPYVPTRPVAPRPFQPPPLVKQKPAAVSRSQPIQAPVAVVPPEENHPLDWKEASIADLMDIRKRRSISSWM